MIQMVCITSNRVGVFVPSLEGGGAERVMVTLANAIAARGYSVDLVLASRQGPYLKDVAGNVRLVDLRAGRVIKALLPLARYLRQQRPEVVLSAMTHANVIALLARRLSHVAIRVLISERGLMSGECAIAQGVPAHVGYWLARRLYPAADGIGTVSRAAANDLANFLKLPIDRVHALNNPFDLDRIAGLAAESVPHPWFAHQQPPLLLAIGRLNEAKDFCTLIRAFAQLRQKRPARLMILGDGELRAPLEALIQECELTAEDIQMPGFVSNPFAYLSRAHLFVLSSRREGLPGVLIEAMACGTPVVSTNCLSGPDEILEGGRWGQLVPVGDVSALAQAITTTLNTPQEQRPNVRLRAQDFVQDQAVDAYLRFLGLPAWADGRVAPMSAPGTAQ